MQCQQHQVSAVSGTWIFFPLAAGDIWQFVSCLSAAATKLFLGCHAGMMFCTGESCCANHYSTLSVRDLCSFQKAHTSVSTVELCQSSSTTNGKASALPQTNRQHTEFVE
jgi:hypothetical protein